MKIERNTNGTIFIEYKGHKINVSHSNKTPTDNEIKLELYKRYGKPYFHKVSEFFKNINAYKPIEKYWDTEWEEWTTGFSIGKLKFIKHYAFQKPNKYRLSLKDIKAYRPYNVNVRWETGEFDQFLKSIRNAKR